MITSWRARSLFLLLAGALTPTSATAAADAEQKRVLDPIVVVAGKVRRPLSEIAAQVTVIDGDGIRTQLAEDLDGILRYEPGLELEAAGTRFGSTAVNIRGIGGNRVAIEVDGVPVREQFAIGSYSNAGRLPVEPHRIKRIEVLHGPGSVMYGSKALGGVVSVTTWDPDDMPRVMNGKTAVTMQAGFQGRNESWVASGTAAWSGPAHGLLAAATRRKGRELENQAPPNTPADPQDWTQDDVLLRYTWDTSTGQRLRLSAERLERRADTKIHSLLGQPPRFSGTTALRGDDREVSRRLTADLEFAAGGWRDGTLRLYHADHDTEQLSYEERRAAAVPVTIERRFDYSHDQTGFEALAFREGESRKIRHRVGLGLKWLRSDISELRDGLRTNLENGSTSKVLIGETMPLRDFPKSQTDEYGLWLQDEITFADGRWQLVPALRWDAYRLDSRPDSIWLEDNPDTELADIDEGRLTPRLGVLFHAANHWSLYAQYAEGFRAPPFQDANIGFDIPLFGYRAIPNPDLRSETSQSMEFGLRRLGPGWQFSLTLFHIDYEDFIESRVPIGRDPQTGDLLFQSRNLAAARIRGVDLRARQELSAWSTALQGWSLNLAAYWSTGENRVNDASINSIAPPQTVIGLEWTSDNGRWDASFTGTFTSKKNRDDIDESVDPRFATPSWTTLDLAAGWRPTERVELRAGIFNVTNEHYWRWLDVANLAADSAIIPLLSRPGRNVSASLRLVY